MDEIDELVANLFEDSVLSLGAIGLLAYLLSRSSPTVEVGEILSSASTTPDSTYDCLDELESHLVVIKSREKQDDGTVRIFYTAFKDPHDHPDFKD